MGRSIRELRNMLLGLDLVASTPLFKRLPPELRGMVIRESVLEWFPHGNMTFYQIKCKWNNVRKRYHDISCRQAMVEQLTRGIVQWRITADVAASIKLAVATAPEANYFLELDHLGRYSLLPPSSTYSASTAVLGISHDGRWPMIDCIMDVAKTAYGPGVRKVCLLWTHHDQPRPILRAFTDPSRVGGPLSREAAYDIFRREYLVHNRHDFSGSRVGTSQWSWAGREHRELQSPEGLFVAAYNGAAAATYPYHEVIRMGKDLEPWVSPEINRHGVSSYVLSIIAQVAKTATSAFDEFETLSILLPTDQPENPLR
ncbi:hypothetical protein BJ170DRAFT_424252 [Xylariales sp. AK1849]|nr:hypothetical protein BJ170DRAFT_424252 [Xylariales sp. AK1849]